MIQGFTFPIRRLRFIASIIVWCICGRTFAQTGVEIARKDSIREVVITGMRPTYNLSSPAPVQSLKGRELERLGNLSAADALRYFSGMQVKDYGGIGGLKTVNIRSMGSMHVGVFYDGIQLGNAQNGVVDLGKFSPDNMEAIDLYNAQKSDIFQSAKDFGSAGTIYMRTIRPKFAEGEKTKMRLKYKTAAYQAIDFPVSYGLTNPSVLLQQKLSDSVRASVGAEWIHANGKYKFRYRRVNADGSTAYDTTAIRRNGDIDACRIEGGLNGTAGGGRWNARAYFYSSHRGLPGHIVNNVFSHGQRLHDRNFFVQGSFDKKTGKRYRFKLSGKYALDRTRYIDADTASTVRIDAVYRQREVYLSAVNKYDLMPFWSVSLSGDFQYNKLSGDIRHDGRNTDNFPSPRRYTVPVALASALTLDRIKLQTSLLGTFVHDKAGEASPGRAEYTPAVFVSFRPFRKSDFYLRAFYKEIFRLPTFNDLYYTFIGNPVLKPEFATQYNLGVTYERLFKNGVFKRFTVQTDVYYNEVTDKIIAIPVSNAFRWQMTNLGTVEIRGADLSASVMAGIAKAYINLRLTYTYQKAQNFTHPAAPDDMRYYGHQIPYVPLHSGSATLSAVYGRWSAHYGFIYAGERYNQKANIRENYVQPWYTSDLSLSGTFDIRGKKLTLTAEVNNLLNQYYDVVQNYPMPGRNYKFAASIDF